MVLLSARCLERQESQDPACRPPGRLQTLHSTLQSLPDGQGGTGVGSSQPLPQVDTQRVGGEGGTALWFLGVSLLPNSWVPRVSLALLPKLTAVQALTMVLSQVPFYRALVLSLSRGHSDRVLLSPLSPPDSPASLHVLSWRAPGSCYPCLPSPDSRDRPHLPLLPPCLHPQLPSPIGLSCVGLWAHLLPVVPSRACTSHSFVPGPA